MTRSFGLTESKLREAEYFLYMLKESRSHSQEAEFCFSAFVSASRSVTFALQSCLNGMDEFDVWYSVAQSTLKKDPLAPYFVGFRNLTQKTGENPIGRLHSINFHSSVRAELSGTARRHVFEHPVTSEIMDAVEACETYMVSLTRIIYDCYIRFRTIVDPQWYFTKDAFEHSGKTFEDALEELGYPRSWSDTLPEGVDGWTVLRRHQPGCAINDIFYNRLGQIVLGPDG